MKKELIEKIKNFIIKTGNDSEDIILCAFITANEEDIEIAKKELNIL